ncbi:MAG: hypothetical protein H0W58_08415 [Acidobacteria bacterium]|jgi:hypothetical protein|nr:hypothetical protein [Acidobacteriota bacterium]
MNKTKKEILTEILGHSILDEQIAKLSKDPISSIRKSLNKELLLNLTTEQFTDSSELCLLEFIEKNFKINQSGKDILDVFEIVQKIAKDELHRSINFHWYARWDEFLDVGNYFTRPDSYDFVEVVIRIEEEFNLKISDEEASNMEGIGMTVRYIWKRLK